MKLMLRLASQSSSHEETNINTNNGGGRMQAERSSFKNNNNNNNNEKRADNLRRRPLAARSGGVCALKASQSEARGGGLRSDGASVCALWSCGRVSHDICALTSVGGFHCFLRAEGGKSVLERLYPAARIGLEHFLLLPLSPAQPPRARNTHKRTFTHTHIYTHTHSLSTLCHHSTQTVIAKF